MRARAEQRNAGARAGRAGFTVVELMISLVIVGIMAMTIAPSLSEMLANNRQTGAAMDLVRLGRRMRAESAATGAAYLMRFSSAGADSSGGLGRIVVYVAMNNKCTQTPWDQTFTAATQGLGAREVFDMADYNPTDGETAPTADDRNRQVILLRGTLAQPRNDLMLCFQPNGEVYTSVGGDVAAAAALAPQTLPVSFAFTRKVNATFLGRTREVIFPRGGNARLR